MISRLLPLLALLAACPDDRDDRPPTFEEDAAGIGGLDAGGGEGEGEGEGPDGGVDSGNGPGGDSGIDAGPQPDDGGVDSGADAAPIPCDVDSDCDDGDPCNDDICSGVCGHLLRDVVDRDADGAEDERCGGNDCDDANPAVPVDAEICNGIDDDCNGMADDGVLASGADVEVSSDVVGQVSLETELDGDGFGALWVDDERVVWFARLDVQGQTLQGPAEVGGPAVADIPGHTSLVAVPGGFIASWCQDDDGDHAAFAFLAEGSPPGEVQDLAFDSNRCNNVAGASSPDVVALVWMAVDGFDLRPVRALLDVVGTPISPPEALGVTATGPSIAVEWLGETFGVFLRAEGGVGRDENGEVVDLGDGGKLLTLAEDGTVGELAEFADGAAIRPEAAWDAALMRAHLVWRDDTADSVRYRAVGSRGELEGATLDLATGATSPALAASGGAILAAWVTDEIEFAPIGDAAQPWGLAASDTGSTPVMVSVAAAPLGFGLLWPEPGGGLIFDQIACANGQACVDEPTCATGLCADSLCCDLPCAGECESCSAEKKGGGWDGTCGPIGAGDPDDECAATECATGLCSSGACEMVWMGAPCGDEASCADGIQTNADVCDGEGDCTDSGTVDCVPYACTEAICASTCTTSADCAPDYGCDWGSCVELASLGAPCERGTQCQNGWCADEVCCDDECTGPCEACSTLVKGGGPNGICGPVGEGLDPGEECFPVECMTGACDGDGACGASPNGHPCGDALSCSGTTQTNQDTCDGTGACRDRGFTACEPYVCGASACLSDCDLDEDCSIGSWCDANECVPQQPSGAVCDDGRECLDGACVDGACCITDDCPTCMECDLGGGACGFIPSGSEDDDSCTGSSSCNGGGLCLLDPGQPCTFDTDCVSGLCVGSFCS
ncbi:MAG: putative metal-binding motif-containing protein [Deltaproteobacteria bacterium]|nr:putative metal-binding motif-containing protein [Deltaproteobacteria bacterium]